MRIDKVAPFYTLEDRRVLAELDAQLDALIEEAKELDNRIFAAQVDKDTELLNELAEKSTDIWVNRYKAVDTAKNERLYSIEQRYIEAFNGDIDAILEDVREIVAATEKEEYLASQKRTTESLKPILEQKPSKGSTSEEKKGYRAAKALSVRGYVNCYYFILERVRVQLNALHFYQSEDGNAKAIAIAEERAGSFYSKPKGAKPARKPQERELPIIKGASVRGDLLTLPTSPALTLLYDVLGGGDLDQLPDRKRSYNRNIQLLVEGQGDKRRISYTKDKTTVSIEIDDFQKIMNRNPQTKKILTRILLRANEQAIHGGELTRTRVSFPLRELVGEGQYKNLETARQGFYNATGTLVGIKVSGKIERGKKKSLGQGRHEVFFTGASVDNATCEIFLNERLNWGLIAPYYTGLPDYYFELPDRAAELLAFIFDLARQNTRRIEEQGYFTIGYRAIQYRLNLPDENTTRNPKRDIKDAIEAAVEQIEEKYCKYAPPIPRDATGTDAEPDFSLLPLGDATAPIKKYLDEGKLKVSLKGEYARRFIDLSHKTAAKIEAARKRRERIENRAIEKALQGAVESDLKGDKKQ